MSDINILYNPLSGSGTALEDARLLEFVFPRQPHYFDITKVTNYSAFLGGMDSDDTLVIAGGDGTLNRFINATEGIDIRQEILYFPIGSGNDFARDFGKRSYADPFPITEYLRELPSVEVNGKTCRFLNGVGFGIDGYCCADGDKLRAVPGKKVNYTSIAIKGLLGGFRARNARVSVDGVEYTYEKVWIAPVMFGRHYGSGMLPAPEQSRTDPEGRLSLMLFHGAGRLRTLCAFPGIFQGTHLKHKSMVAIHSGHEITVEFDRPTPLQIDGETVLGVTGYTARSPRRSEKRNKIFSMAGETIV